MNPQRFQRLTELFHGASELPEEQRPAFFDRLCDDDSELRRVAEELLRYDDESPAAETIDPTPRQEPVTEPPPPRIGPYRVLQVLGQGGMGVVYRAEQQEPVHRLVAIKLIKLGMDSEEMLARFELERRAIASMNHSSIARVLEVGTTQRGQPYFVMELVDGIPITRYCDEHRLSLAERIRLFQQVCHGVQHAHQNGVIHRDLKTDNILVVREGEQPLAKILDFGLAKATRGDPLAETVYTQRGQILGTLDYMSPEQLLGEDVDARTDVYALGVILYELLVGQLPFDPDDLRRGGYPTLHQFIHNVFADNPSRRVRLSRATVPPGMEVSALIRSLKGDLDWTVMKALEKNRERRYASARELAEDLRRFLVGEPVEAPIRGRLLRVYRWTRRHQQLSVRIAAFPIFYAITLIELAVGSVEWDFTWHIAIVLAAWTAASCALDWLISHRRWGHGAQLGWATADVSMFTCVLLIGDGVASSMVLIYPLLIVGSGLWFRRRVVAFMTFMVFLSYSVLIAHSSLWPPPPELSVDVFQHLIFAASILILGTLVGLMVKRAVTMHRT